jgi:REP element-mobilizing transposase RayT
MLPITSGLSRSCWLARSRVNDMVTLPNFWARGYFVSTVGANEDVVRAYIREQEQEDHRIEQLNLFK